MRNRTRTSKIAPMATRRLAALAALLMLLVPALSGQGTILFRAPYGATTWNSSADVWWEQADAFGTRWSSARVAGAGPQGQDVVQLTELSGTGQHGWGWHGHVVPDLSPGGRRFYRWRHKIVSVTQNTSNKLLVIAQGCAGSGCRTIVQTNVQQQADGSFKLQYKFQIDGGVFQVETGFIFPIGQWHNIQFETQAGTNDTQANGYLKLWVNNDTYASPTIQNLNIGLRSGTTESSYIIFGGYNNNESFSGTNVQQYTDLEIATAFHPSWNVGTAAPTPPAAAQTVRVIQ